MQKILAILTIKECIWKTKCNYQINNILALWEENHTYRMQTNCLTVAHWTPTQIFRKTLYLKNRELEIQAIR